MAYQPTFYPLLNGPSYSCAISTPRRANNPAAISAHCHLCPTRYSFTPELSGACPGKVPYLRTQHRNNVPILRGEKHYIALKMSHHAGFGFETARQAATLAKRHALTIASRPSLSTFISCIKIKTRFTLCF